MFVHLVLTYIGCVSLLDGRATGSLVWPDMSGRNCMNVPVLLQQCGGVGDFLLAKETGKS